MPPHAHELSIRLTRWRKFPVYAVRREYDFRVAAALKNVLVHSPIPCVAAAITAGCVHHDRAARFAGAWIEVYNAALQPEGAVYGMQDISESEVYRGAR